MGKPALVQDEDTVDWLSEAQHIASLHQPASTGRPSVITDLFRVQKLLRLVAAGNYIETACAAAGFPKSTLHNWKRAATDGDLAAIAFVNALEKAEAIAEAEANGNVREAGKLPQFWAAAMTHLERRHPDRWGRRTDSNDTPKVIVQIGAGSGDVKVGVLLVSPQNTEARGEGLQNR